MKKIISAALSAALIFALLCGCGEPKKATTPIDFSGKTFDEVLDWSIKNELEDRFSYEFEYSETVESGKVIAQSVEKGGSLENGIKITVSNGKQPAEIEPGSVLIPNVIGKDMYDAMQECSYSGIAVDNITYIKTNLPTGTVLKTEPLCGNYVLFGGSINMVCSEQTEGSKKVAVMLDWSTLCFETEEVEIEAYLEDKQITSQSKSVPVANNFAQVIFEAEGGKKNAKVLLNGIEQKYEIDFDNDDYILIQ